MRAWAGGAGAGTCSFWRGVSVFVKGCWHIGARCCAEQRQARRIVFG